MSATLGILGGGQLAMLMCQAARDAGVSTIVASPDPAAPARRDCDRFLQAPLDDPEMLRTLAGSASVVTIDHEHVPAGALQALSPKVHLAPGLEAIRCIQDRLEQRNFLHKLNIPQTRFLGIHEQSLVRSARGTEPFPAVLKRRAGGYDGYGQVRVADAAGLQAAWEKLECAPCILESWVPGIHEFSVLGAVGADRETRLFPPAANQHRDGQLVRSEMPASLPAGIGEEAVDYWHRIADGLAYQGLLTVEFFLTPEGGVLVNEIAPRVHNSGHVTQFACTHDQFELHVRAVMGLPLPEPELKAPGVMLNLYPQHRCIDPQVAADWQARVGGQIVLYGKEPRPRRKMGHWLLPADAAEAALKLMADTGSRAGGQIATAGGR